MFSLLRLLIRAHCCREVPASPKTFSFPHLVPNTRSLSKKKKNTQLATRRYSNKVVMSPYGPKGDMPIGAGDVCFLGAERIRGRQTGDVCKWPTPTSRLSLPCRADARSGSKSPRATLQ